MTHQIEAKNLLNGNEKQEFKTLLAASSSDNKRLFHVLVITEESTYTYFSVETKDGNFKVDGLHRSIREYNKH